jgi:hypothetical protein
MITTKYDGVKLNENKGVYELVATSCKGDKEYDKWATYQIGKDKHAEKDWPVKVVLGDMLMAKATLAFLYKEIAGEDIPF